MVRVICKDFFWLSINNSLRIVLLLMTMPADWKSSSKQVSNQDERILWRNEVTKGIIHRTVVEVQVITNYRVLQNNFGISLKDLDDIVYYYYNHKST